MNESKGSDWFSHPEQIETARVRVIGDEPIAEIMKRIKADRREFIRRTSLETFQQWMEDIAKDEAERGEERQPGEIAGYAYRENSGELDLDSISDTPENVRIKYLQMCMGWRFEHPDRYSQDEEWERLLGYGSVVSVRVLVADE